MWKYICYKEWIKIGKLSILLVVLGVLLIVGIYTTVRHDLVINDSEAYWNGIINRNTIYFSILKFVPLIMGILIALAQFVPEITEKRIKLTLHLPLNEEAAVLKMVLFGASVTALLFLLMFAVFLTIGSFYFPVEILSLTALSILPWFLAGLAAFFLIAFIVMEPNWKFRILYSLLSVAFLNLFYKGYLAGDYLPALFPLILLILASSTSVLYSIHRFRKGII